MLIFDIETDGLLDTVTTLHCMAIYDTKTTQMYGFTPDNVVDGVKMLQQAIDRGEKICGHNIINFDIPALEKLYDFFEVDYEHHKYVIDTLVLSRLIYSNIDTIDLGLMKSGKLPKKLYKSHSLKAWGYRLGNLKGDYGEQEEAWAVYNEEMLTYNKQDVEVTKDLYMKLKNTNYSETAIQLEHDVAWLMAKQERNGFKFDYAGAKKLAEKLQARQAVLTSKLLSMIPELPDRVFVPKRDNKRLGYKAGVPIQKYKTFNPNSRQQIEYVFRKMYNYNPMNVELYDIPDMPDEDNIDLSKYRLKIDDETLGYIKDDPQCPKGLKEIAGILQESLMLSKRLGQIIDGTNNWIDAYNPADGCIHGRVIPNGAVSGRATHSNPNVAQVPHVGSPYGAECRALWNAGDWVQVGVDACGLELRCLAHFLHKYDGGLYADTILHGDIHTMNQQAAGLPTRNQAKTFIYCFL